MQHHAYKYPIISKPDQTSIRCHYGLEFPLRVVQNPALFYKDLGRDCDLETRSLCLHNSCIELDLRRTEIQLGQAVDIWLNLSL